MSSDGDEIRDAKSCPEEDLKIKGNLKVEGDGKVLGDFTVKKSLSAHDVKVENTLDLEGSQLKIVNSLLENLVTLKSDLFRIEITYNGLVKIVPRYNDCYTGEVIIRKDGRTVYIGENYQSGLYAWQLFRFLTNPIDGAAMIRGILGIIPTYGEFAFGTTADFSKLLVAYSKIKLQKLETEGKLPVLLLSLAKAMQVACNDAYNLLIPSLKPYVDLRAFTTMDFLVVLIVWNHLYGQEIIIGANLEAHYWLNTLANFNGQANVSPLPNNDLGIVNTTPFPGMSSFLSLGKDYLSDAKSFNIGSNHWYNMGSYRIEIPHIEVPKEKLVTEVLASGGVPLFATFSRDPGMSCIPFTVGAEVDNSYFDLSLTSDNTQYYIGDITYPITFEGPLVITLSGVTYQWTVPRTAYGPIIAMNSTANPISLPLVTGAGISTEYILAPHHVLCILDPFSPGFLEATESQARGVATNTEEWNEQRRKYGEFGFFSAGHSCIDNKGRIGAVANQTNLSPSPEFLKRLEQGVYNPTTNKDIDWINAAVPPYAKKVVDGSDVTIYSSYYTPQNTFDQTEITQTNVPYLGTGVITTAIQHSNSLYIDQNPLQTPDLLRAAYIAAISGRFLLTNIGVIIPDPHINIPAGPLPLEATRALSASIIIGASNTSPIVITVSGGTAPPTGTIVTIVGVTGNTAANGTWVVINLSSTTFSLNGSIGNGNYFSGGVIDNEFQAMRQISTYPIMRARNVNNWWKIYSRLNLAYWSKTVGYYISPNVNDWKNAGKMTLKQAKSMYHDYGMPNIYPFWAPMLQAILTGISAGINWSQPYFNQPTASNNAYPYVAYPGSVYAANRPAIDTTLPGIAFLLSNFDPTTGYSLDARGTFLVLAMLYRALQRYNITNQNFITVRIKAANTQFSGLTSTLNTATAPGYSGDSASNAFLQSIASNKFNEYKHVLVNFAQVNGIYSQTRPLTVDDQWQIFINRMTYPNGFNGAQSVDISDPTQPIDPQLVQDLIMGGLVDALVDIGQLNNSWLLSYVDSDFKVKEVTSTAVTLFEKASRTWGSVSTLVFPYDYDSTGTAYRQYPIPYGQERIFGSSLYQYYDAGNFTTICAPFSPAQKPTALGANTNNGIGVTNGTTAANRIFNPTYGGNGPNSLYKNGYVKQGGGSAFQRFVEGTSSHKPLTEHFYAPWGEGDSICDFLYRGDIHYLQNGICPTEEEHKSKQYVFDTDKYDRTTFNHKTEAKPGAIVDGLI